VSAFDDPFGEKSSVLLLTMQVDTSPAVTTLGQTKFGETVTNDPD
jgi:hypothetical protein